MVKDLLKPVKIPKVWRYSESWCERNIERLYDLDKTCRNSSAEFDIIYCLRTYAQDYYNNTKSMNEWLSRISIEYVESMPPAEINGLIDKMAGHTYKYLRETHWINEKEIELKVVNYQKTPEPVVAAVDDALDICRRGREKHLQVVDYLKDVERDRFAAMEAAGQEGKFNDYMDKWRKVKLRHVTVTSGFIYLLSHELMPGIYKIGFTSRNPDKRAEELSREHKLPPDFKVEKYWRTEDPYIVEQRIHKALQDNQKPGEFFAGDISYFKSVVESHVMKPE